MQRKINLYVILLAASTSFVLAWVDSNFETDYGKFADRDEWVETTEDAKKYARTTVAHTPSGVADPLTRKGVDMHLSSLIFQPEGLTCGGSYLKLGHQSAMNPFHADTDYSVMFGPDSHCNGQHSIHTILKNHQTGKNYELTPRLEGQTPDGKWHHYTLSLFGGNNSVIVRVDGVMVSNQPLTIDKWKMLPPEMMDDPTDLKPTDWVDEEEIVDPNDQKPTDWPDDEPLLIQDANAVQPEDWDSEDDGEWEAPEVNNPAYKGEWVPARIKNPAFQGIWTPRKIPNPEYIPDENLVRKICRNDTHLCNTIGIDVWTMTAGVRWARVSVTESWEEMLVEIDDALQWIGGHTENNETEIDDTEETNGDSESVSVVETEEQSLHTEL